MIGSQLMSAIAVYRAHVIFLLQTVTHLEAHIQGQRASALCDWVETCHTRKRFAGSAETLAAIQLTSRRDWWEVLRSALFSSGDILRAAYNLPVWDQSSEECMAGRVLKRIAKVVSHCHSFQHSEWQIEGQTHGWRANWRAKRGSHWHSPLQFFSALCPPYTLHQSLLWSYMGRLYAALKMSPGEKSAERHSAHHHVWMSTEWQRVFLHFLQSALLVWQVSTQSQRALALCPWMWASKRVTVWHQHKGECQCEPVCPPVCPSTVSLPLDLPLRVLKRVIVWHHLYSAAALPIVTPM